MGVACVRSLQGDADLPSTERLIATGKHFVAHGQPEGGTNAAPIDCGERTLRETFLPPFKAAVRRAKIGSIMPSYNEIEGIPSHGNHWLNETLLRKEWGFDGTIVSDYFAINQLQELHFMSEDRAAPAKRAIESGVDIELPDPSCYPRLIALVESGRLDLSLIDRSVARILTQKFQLGLFDSPYVEVEAAVNAANCQAHRELALEAARQSMVLLKNKNEILPLNAETLKSIAVVGPNADLINLGGYSDNPGRSVSIF